MFYDIFVDLCLKAGKSQAGAVQDIGLNRAAINKWKSGSIPTGTTASKLASYFGVSVDYLLGNEKKPVADNDYELLKDEFVAFYGDVKKELTQSDIEDLKALVRLRAELNRDKK